MTTVQRRRRLAMIRILAETSPSEQGSLSREPTDRELAAARETATRAGAMWVARHRGIVGLDHRDRLPRSRGLQSAPR